MELEDELIKISNELFDKYQAAFYEVWYNRDQDDSEYRGRLIEQFSEQMGDEFELYAQEQYTKLFLKFNRKLSEDTTAAIKASESEKLGPDYKTLIGYLFELQNMIDSYLATKSTNVPMEWEKPSRTDNFEYNDVEMYDSSDDGEESEYQDANEGAEEE
mmetsp:Transcript_5464/g.9246  ORF Transcript_5464/g.9246 Transcript_5464/m.9246 type:complete len:159 (-) Transcript_5464:70-546(-)